MRGKAENPQPSFRVHDLTSPHSSPLTPDSRSDTVLAFDFGTRRIGVAVGERRLGIAHPLTAIEAEGYAAQLAAIEAVVAEWQPGRLVVGLPLAMDGSEHDMTRSARKFGRRLEARFALPVTYVDERLSSHAAAERVGAGRRKSELDRAAAQIILQDFFDQPEGARP